MNEPLVSVVMAVYNGETFLREAIESALAQTYGPLEIVVVDDGSTDGSAAILESFAPKLRIFHQENAGQAAARNLGISKASGEWIGFLDQDDLWDPRKTELQLNAAQVDDAVIHAVPRIIDSSGSVHQARIMNPQRSAAIADLIRSSTLSICTALVRRSALADIGGFDPRNRFGTEDYQLWLRLAAKGYRFRFLDEVLASRRLHDGNFSSDHRRMQCGFIYAIQTTRSEYPAAFGRVERRAADMAPGRFEFDAAWQLYVRGDYARAARHFRRAVWLWPFSATYWLYAAAVSLPFRRLFLPGLRALVRGIRFCRG
jgi:glycosyltransferase involved in cell wall biosynthesis